MTTILCIEDEPELREDIAEELASAGYDVKQARDGHEGLQMIINYKPSLVLCDITMPRKNGYQLLKEIRENYSIFAEMPFIFVSALADRERILAGLSDGADAYLTKPIDYELLLATVKASLRQIDRIKDNQKQQYVLDD